MTASAKASYFGTTERTVQGLAPIIGQEIFKTIAQRQRVAGAVSTDK